MHCNALHLIDRQSKKNRKGNLKSHCRRAWRCTSLERLLGKLAEGVQQDGRGTEKVGKHLKTKSRV